MKSPHTNILHPRESFTARQSREEVLISRSIQGIFAILMLLGVAIRLGSLPFTGSLNWVYLSTILVALLLSVGVLIIHTESGYWRRVQMIGFLSLAQGYAVVMVTQVYTNSLSVWCVSSTVVFCLYEMACFRNQWVVLLLLIRQFALWKFVSIYLEKEAANWNLPYFMMIGIITLILYCNNQAKKREIERLRLFESIDEEHMKIQSLLQAIPEGVAVILETLEVPCFNSKLKFVLGLSDEENIVEKLKVVSCSEHESSVRCDPLMAQVEMFLYHASIDSTVFGVTCVGEKCYEWKGTKCIWGKTAACIITASDISSWAAARTRLQQESDSKTSLLRFVSHELRTPTNAILNLVLNVMEADNINEEQKKDLKIVTASTHFLLLVVNDLLDFSRMIADKFSLVKQNFDIRKEIRDTVQLIELQCAQKSVFLATKVDDLVPQMIYSDPNRLKQVLLNLLGNALKFTFRGGIRVVCNMTDSNSLKISVKDTGVGIPSHKIAGLCQAFEMVEGTKQINPQGCGLGLYISNLLVQCLGSKSIQIASKESIGSEFSFEIDIFQHEIKAEEGVIDYTTEQIEDEREFETRVCLKALIGGKGEYQLAAPEVLIVDDCDFNRLVLVKMLISLGVSADTASTGLRALSAIREGIRRGRCYRLILMDMEMPEMDGVTATQEIRAMEQTGELVQSPRIVACSAHRSREDYDRCIKAGMDGYIEKPISRLKLEGLIESL